MARWRGSCGSAELALLLLLHFWPVRNKKLKKKILRGNKQGILGSCSGYPTVTPRPQMGEMFHISTGISVPYMLKEITQV